MKHIPDLVSKLGYGLLIVDINSVFRARLEEHADLVPLSAEHDNSLDEGGRPNDTLHRCRDCLLS